LFFGEVGSLLTWVEPEPPQDTEELYLRKVDCSAAWTPSIRLQAFFLVYNSFWNQIIESNDSWTF
jgi:hypothetical protein